MIEVRDRVAVLAAEHAECDEGCDTKLLICLMLKAFEDGAVWGAKAASELVGRACSKDDLLRKRLHNQLSTLPL